MATAAKAPPCIVVSEDPSAHIPAELLALPAHYRGTVGSVLISHGLVRDRVDQLARDIVQQSSGPLVAVCVLKGGAAFYSDLWLAVSRLNADRAEPVPIQVEFVRLQSYVNDRSTGTVVITGLDLAKLRGKDVLIVEDIVDTGRSAVAVVKAINDAGATRVRFASLLVKRTPESNGFTPDFVGFSIPNLFVVGYCLDYNEHYRDLAHICVINDVGKARFAV